MDSKRLRISPDLTVSEHQANLARMKREGLTGLTLSCYGGAYGPIFPAGVDYDLSFLAHYPGITSLELQLPGQTSLEALKYVETSLESLSLGSTRKASLEPVGRCLKLKRLSNVENTKDVGVLAGLRSLEVLWLREHPKSGFL